MKASDRIRQGVLRQGLSFASAIVLALVLGLVMLALDGYAPRDVVGSVYSSTFASSFRFANMVSRLVVIVLVALAAAVPFKAGIWNIGGDGQMTIGGFVAALVGVYVTGLPPLVHIGLAVMVGIVGGALWATVPAILRLRYKANEIVTTIMMNYVATLLVGYLVNYPFRAAGSANAETSLIQNTAVLTRLVTLSNLSAGIYLAVAAFLAICVLDWMTSWGYEWKVLGANDEFARYGGVRETQMRFLAMAIGGGLAGLAGSIQVLGMYYKYTFGMGGGVGFTGVLIALIAANSPILILFVSMIFAFLVGGTVGLEARLGLATEFSSILQSIIILLVIARSKLWGAISALGKRGKRYGESG